MDAYSVKILEIKYMKTSNNIITQILDKLSQLWIPDIVPQNPEASRQYRLVENCDKDDWKYEVQYLHLVDRCWRYSYSSKSKRLAIRKLNKLRMYERERQGIKIIDE